MHRWSSFVFSFPLCLQVFSFPLLHSVFPFPSLSESPLVRVPVSLFIIPMCGCVCVGGGGSYSVLGFDFFCCCLFVFSS